MDEVTHAKVMLCVSLILCRILEPLCHIKDIVMHISLGGLNMTSLMALA